MNAVTAATLCLLMFLAGCLGPGSDDTTRTPPDPEPEAPAPSVETFSFPLGAALAVGNRSAPESPSVQLNGTNPASDVRISGHFNVRPNATAVIVEARAECATPNCRFYAEMGAPGASRFTVLGRSHTFDGTLWWAYSPGQEGPGKRTLTFRADSANLAMEGEGRVSVFYGQPVPEGFSAFATP